MKRQRLIAVLLIVLILINGSFVFAADETPEQAYEKGYAQGTTDADKMDYIPDTDKILSNYDGVHIEDYIKGYKDGFFISGETQGTKMGRNLGEVYGTRDFINGKNSNWSARIPHDNAILSMYNLWTETDGYKAKFLKDFKLAFEDSYKKAFEKANLDPISSSSEAGKRDGIAVGSALGEMFGAKDFNGARPNNYKSVMPTDAQIISSYSLSNDNTTYREAFLNSFKIAFELNYEKAYREANIAEKEGQAYNKGYNFGLLDGEQIAKEKLAIGELLPVEMVRLSSYQIRAKYNSQLDGQNEIYIEDFIKGFQDGFKIGYESSSKEYFDSFNMGYNSGKSLASRNNSDKNFLPYDAVKLTDHQIIINNYEYLKDKDEKFIWDFVRGYQLGFEKGYKEVIMTSDIEEARTQGAKMGTALGDVYGAKDFIDKKISDWKRAIPSDTEIIKMYNLSIETNSYRVQFLSDFKVAFEEAYKKAYENANLDPILSSAEAGKKDGAAVGKALGEMLGAKDFKEGKASNYLLVMPNDEKIILDYDLAKDNESYREAFINSFKIAFELNYEKAYREANMEDKEGKAYRTGFIFGEDDGDKKAEAIIATGDLLPVDFVRLTTIEIKTKYNLQLIGKDSIYVDDFIKGYQDGFKEGYENRSVIFEQYLDGYNKGYTEGKALASKNNDEKKYLPYEEVKLTNNKVISYNYDYLKNKDTKFIDNFVRGYQEGHEKGYKEVIIIPDADHPYNVGFEFGKVDGVEKAQQLLDEGELLPINSAKPTSEEIKTKYAINLAGKEDIYINVFVDGYLSGFVEGYESVDILSQDYLDGYNRGYKSGKDLAIKNNADQNFMSYDKVRLSDSQVMTINYDYLKNKGKEFIDNFVKGYKEGHEKGYNETIRTEEIEDAQTQGAKMGTALGEAYGAKDYYNDKASNWRNALPSDTEIIDMYNLGKETESYRISFLSDFKKAFEVSYKNAYEKANLDPMSSSTDAGKKDGTALGAALGEFHGKDDFKDNKPSNYILVLPSDDRIVADYNLSKDNMAYREAFISSFKTAFKVNYERAYREANMEDIEGKAYLTGYNFGVAIGEEVAGETLEIGDLLPVDMVRLTSDEIKTKYSEELDGKNAIYIEDFIKGFQEGFGVGYESLISIVEQYNDGFDRGYDAGKSLASKNNDEKKYLPYDDVKLTNNQVISSNNEYLKDKDEEHIDNFVRGYHKGHEKGYKEVIKTGDDDIDDSKPYNIGFEFGKTDGQKIGKEILDKGQLKPVDDVRLTTNEIKENYANELADKDASYIVDFIKGYQDGFKVGYEKANISTAEYLDGFNRGYKYGQELATKNNADKNFLPYEMVKLKDTQVMGNNYEYLKDKGNDFILNFVRGYQEGYEKGYKEVIKTGPDEEDKTTISSNFGASFGLVYGEMAGIRDYQDGISPNWSRALPRESEIISMFNLRNLPSDERYEFLDKFTTNFEIGYEKSYYNAHFGGVRDNVNSGNSDGTTFGTSLGTIFGAKDYYEKRHSDFTRDLPSDREIIANYSLSRDNSEYERGFVSGFKKAYEAAYTKAFRDSSKNDTIRNEKDAFMHGKEAGRVRGELAATNDYLQQLYNDWRRALPSNDDVVNEYNLRLQSANYRDGFISGFFDGYSEGYNEKFKEFSQGSAMNKTNSALIPIRGGFLNSLDNAFAVNITEGTYYHPVNLAIDTVYNNNIYSSNIFIKASDNYNVRLLNTSNNFDDNKLIEVAFEYYGDKLKGGIYRYVDNRWIYLPSKIENGVISTLIKPSSLNNPATFSVFLDSNVKVLTDARGHWAKDEIDAFVRRGFISGYNDSTFKPEKGITRGEFITLLTRVYNWNLDYYYGYASKFKDVSSNSALNNIVNYATAYGYISGYPDGTFKPNNPISYKEAETIMRRINSNYNFKWQDIATKMLHERLVKSNSFKNINNQITRAEVVYMLYQLNASKY